MSLVLSTASARLPTITSGMTPQTAKLISPIKNLTSSWSTRSPMSQPSSLTMIFLPTSPLTTLEEEKTSTRGVDNFTSRSLHREEFRVVDWMVNLAGSTTQDDDEDRDNERTCEAKERRAQLKAVPKIPKSTGIRLQESAATVPAPSKKQVI